MVRGSEPCHLAKMNRRFWGLFWVVASTLFAADDDGFTALFNGHDLSGWKNVNCAPETWSVRDGVIFCTGRPTGALRTTRQYENFILELEWRHLSSGGNSGIFIWSSPIAAPGVPFLRAIEVQVLDHGYNVPGKNEWFTTHGDVFPIHGSSMKPFGRHNGQRSFPSEERSHGSPDWNHYRITCTNGVLRLEVNGQAVSGGSECSYRMGYVGLESEGAPIEFRHLKLKELPSSGVPPEAASPEDLGWQPLFTGLDLRGWQTNELTSQRWGVRNERLLLRPGASSAESMLRSETEFGDTEFVIDCLMNKPDAGAENSVPTVQLRGVDVKLVGAIPGGYQRFSITVKGREVTVKRNEVGTQRLQLPATSPSKSALGLRAIDGSAEFMNLYARPI